MEPAATQSGRQQPAPTDIYPAALAAAERELIAARREALQLPGSDANLGVAVSGGGIRSATFALGLFQALARRGLLKHIDYLSTVSGGGYFGGFLGKLFLSAGRDGTPEQSLNQTTAALADSQSAPVRWLRENGRYIAPTGSGDYFSAAAIYLRNWLAVQYVVGTTLLGIFLFSNTVRAWLWTRASELGLETLLLPKFWLSPWLLVPALLAALVMVPLGGAYWLTQQNPLVGQSSAPARIAPDYPMITLFLIVVLAAIALYVSPDPTRQWLPNGQAAKLIYAYVIVSSVLAAAIYLAAGWLSPGEDVSITRNWLSRGLGRALLLFVMLTVFGLVDSLGQTAYALFKASTTSRPIAVTGAVTLVLVFLARQFASYLSVDQTSKPKRVRIPTQMIGFAVGVLLALVVATFWSAVAHGVLWKGDVPSGNPGQQIIDYYQTPKPQVSLSNENYIVVSPPQARSALVAQKEPAVMLASVALLIALLINGLTGRTLTFLNLSSIQQFYAARLSRAYLGASNPRRTGFAADAAAGAQPIVQDVTEAIEGDDVPFSGYRPERHGGPLHLINVTVNETLAGASQLEQRDRKGLGMAVGPAGISVARVHHAVWSGDEMQRRRAITPVGSLSSPFLVFGRAPVAVESLSVGQWVAISGAAFTTGLGARTNLGMSLLLGFSNVRIGYWWDSGIVPRSREDAQATAAKRNPTNLLEPMFPAQVYLSDEFLARFHGPHRQRWYLSDGGHYENTGVYELIRRRLPFMLVSDNGRDDDYTFEDLANLIRKARIDFNAEIRFLEGSELDRLLSPQLRQIIGTPAELQRRAHPDAAAHDDEGLHGNAYSRCHALLARVFYDGQVEPGSVLLLVKPSLAGDEPVDVLQYHAQHPTFPQESTLDQFFDEAQWESYHKLGSHIGDKLFEAIGPLDTFAALLTTPRV